MALKWWANIKLTGQQCWLDAYTKPKLKSIALLPMRFIAKRNELFITHFFFLFVHRFEVSLYQGALCWPVDMSIIIGLPLYNIHWYDLWFKRSFSSTFFHRCLLSDRTYSIGIFSTLIISIGQTDIVSSSRHIEKFIESCHDRLLSIRQNWTWIWTLANVLIVYTL